MGFKCTDKPACVNCPVNRIKSSLENLLRGKAHPFKANDQPLEIGDFRRMLIEQLKVKGIDDLTDTRVVVPMTLVGDNGSISVEMPISVILDDSDKDRSVTFNIAALDRTALSNTCSDFQIQVEIDRSHMSRGRWTGGITPEA